MEGRNLSLTKKKIISSIRRRKALDRIFSLLAFFASTISILFLIIFLAGVFSQGASWVDWQFITSTPSRFPEKAGILPALAGTFWLMLLTALISIPLGISTAIYLEEYSKKNLLAKIISINISNLAGVPSIIYGILGLVIFVRTIALGRSILSGALTMSLLILPIIIIATQEALKTVPKSLREASLSLGATNWQTVRHVVLPSGFPGILTGIILALARAIGETAPLITIGALSFVAFVPKSPMDPFAVLPIQIYNWASRPQQEFQNLAAAAIIVLLALFLLLNGIAVILRHKASKKLR